MENTDICVLCDINPATTREHVPPRGLFIKPLPNDLITVPACDTCNGGSSIEDEKSKVYTSLFSGANSEAQIKFWKDGALRTLNRNKKLRAEIIDNIVRVPVFSPTGLFLGESDAALMDAEIHNSTICKITKGLYYWVTKDVLPQSVEINISLYDGNGFPEGLMETMENQPLISRGNHHEFICKYGIAQDADFASIWLYQFHQGHFIVADTRVMQN